jgi:murein DD-endopeptidase MepM/ murein hydrolase activator NlpD
VYHHVKAGENLYRIGKAYGVPYQKIARANRIRDPSRIEVGQKLLIPGAKKAVPVDLVAPRSASVERPRGKIADPRAPRFMWPLTSGTVASSFGPRHGGFHDGIDISAKVGAPVRAAADGEVVFSSGLAGYGNVVIVRHTGGYATVYAHNDQNHVKEGDRVRRGQLIASVGRTGRTTGPNLHFEVRKDNVAKNPIYFLPSTMQADRDRAPAALEGG